MNERNTDGIRDTPPQLPAKFAAGKEPAEAIFFECNADGTFNPNAAGMQPQALSCAAGGNLYFNNFYNTMSYWTSRCAANRRTPRSRQTTFTPGQIARMRCAWRCFRQQECTAGGGGTFPF